MKRIVITVDGNGRLSIPSNKKNYRLGATFSASYMGEKKFDVQDRLSVNGESHDAYFRCKLPQ